MQKDDLETRLLQIEQEIENAQKEFADFKQNILTKISDIKAKKYVETPVKKIEIDVGDYIDSSEDSDNEPIKRKRFIHGIEDENLMKFLKLSDDEINMISNKPEDDIYNETEKSILKKQHDLEEFKKLDSKEYYCFINKQTYFYNEMCQTLCYHDKPFSLCKRCEGGGWNLCRKCTKIHGKYHNRGYCNQCFSNMFSLEKHNKSYKKREFAVIDFILKTFPNFNWAHDEKIELNYKTSNRRPDLILELSDRYIMIEIDEKQHKKYSIFDDKKRLEDISSYLKHGLKLIIIRFNPDNFFDHKGVRYKSCWKKCSIEKDMLIIEDKQKEWNYRLNILKKVIEKYLNPTILPSQDVITIKLFFDFFKSKNMKLHI